jgi:hypothetical protein
MCNDPPIEWLCPEADAAKVFTSLTFYRLPNGEKLFGPIEGRWSDAKQPIDLSPYSSLDGMSEVGFAANGKPHSLDIAIKHLDDQVCYAFSSPSFYAERGCRADWVLVGAEFRVEVTLKGHGLAETINYKLINHGRGNELEIERLTEPEPTS